MSDSRWWGSDFYELEQHNLLFSLVATLNYEGSKNPEHIFMKIGRQWEATVSDWEEIQNCNHLG